MADNINLQEIAAKLLEHETSPEVLEIKRMMLRRIATESDIKPSRIPAPLNITEIGGYINLLTKLHREENEMLKQDKLLRQNEMLRHVLSSILGLPVQTPME